MEDLLNEHDNRLKQAEILDHFHIYIRYGRTPLEAIERIELTTSFRDPQSKEFIHALRYIYTSDKPFGSVTTIHQKYSEHVTENLEVFYVIFAGDNHEKAAEYLRTKNTHNEAKRLFSKIVLLDNSPGVHYPQKGLFKIMSKNEKNPKILKEISKPKIHTNAFSTILPRHINLLVKNIIKSNSLYGYIDILKLDFNIEDNQNRIAFPSKKKENMEACTLLRISENRKIKAQIIDYYNVCVSYGRRMSFASMLEKSELSKSRQSKEFINSLQYINTTKDKEKALYGMHQHPTELIRNDYEIYYMLRTNDEETIKDIADYLRNKSDYSEAKILLLKIEHLHQAGYEINRIFNIIRQGETNENIKEALTKNEGYVDGEINDLMFRNVLPHHINMMFQALTERRQPLSMIREINKLQF